MVIDDHAESGHVEYVEIEAPDEPPTAACKRCKVPFDQADTRFDGAAQYGTSGFCKKCIDRCHEATEFDHICDVCRAPGEKTGS